MTNEWNENSWIIMMVESLSMSDSTKHWYDNCSVVWLEAFFTRYNILGPFLMKRKYCCCDKTWSFFLLLSVNSMKSPWTRSDIAIAWLQLMQRITAGRNVSHRDGTISMRITWLPLFLSYSSSKSLSFTHTPIQETQGGGRGTDRETEHKLTTQTDSFLAGTVEVPHRKDSRKKK